MGGKRRALARALLGPPPILLNVFLLGTSCKCDCILILSEKAQMQLLSRKHMEKCLNTALSLTNPLIQTSIRIKQPEHHLQNIQDVLR